MTLLINDLQQNLELDSQAMAGVRGGHSAYGSQMHAIMPRMPSFGAPHYYSSQSLSNFSDQLNLAVGSANLMHRRRQRQPDAGQQQLGHAVLIDTHAPSKTGPRGRFSRFIPPPNASLIEASSPERMA